MKDHISTRPGGDDNPEPAETPQHERRFDERGIALQTIIIMVVLLAIAGAVAAVLFNRASTETQRLDDQTTQVETYAITNDVLCRQAGGEWKEDAMATSEAGKATPNVDADGLKAAGRLEANIPAGAGWCKPG